MFSPVKVEESYNQGNVIYVSNINRKITDEALKQAFAKFGAIKSINLIKDPFTKYCSYVVSQEDLHSSISKNWKMPQRQLRKWMARSSKEGNIIIQSDKSGKIKKGEIS